MSATRESLPEVVFALPGEWVRADLRDDRQVAELTDLMDGVADDPVAWIAGTTAVGGVLMMFRIRSEPPVALLFAWPPGEEDGDASMSGLRGRLGVDGAPVDHAAGYACVRERSQSGADGADVLTYGLVHPDSGRLLVVRFTAFGAPFDEIDLDDYDLSVGHMWWEEPDA